MNISYKLPVDSGKYTFIVYEGDWRIHVLRYSEPWMIIEKGHNAIFSLLYEAIEAKDELKALKDLEEKAKVFKAPSDKFGRNADEDIKCLTEYPE